MRASGCRAPSSGVSVVSGGAAIADKLEAHFDPNDSEGSMKRSRTDLLAFVIGLLSVPLSPLVTAQSTNEWITLFDGSTLDGWNTIGDANWTLADGTVRADSGTGFLVTNESYGNFQLTLEFWVGDKANSGVFIRCADPSQVGADNSYEINIADTHQNPEFRSGSIVRLTPPARTVTTAGKWNTYDITARGTRLTVILNGIQTADVENGDHAHGPFALQRREGTVKFRNVRIRPL